MNIKLGACAPFTMADHVANVGGTHIESGFAVYTNKSAEDFAREKEILLASPLRPYSMNSMLPGDFVLYGTKEQSDAVCEFVRRGMERAAQVECKSVCMGSGKARSIPEGMTRDEAADRLATLCARFCEIAGEYGIKIAIEPLRTAETNFIHTLDDAYDIIRRVPECKNLGINPDMYHMYQNNDDFSNLVKLKDYVFNVHIAEPIERSFPKPGNAECDKLYVEFFTALKASGYAGNVSIEAITKDFAGEVGPTLAHLNEIAANI